MLNEESDILDNAIKVVDATNSKLSLKFFLVNSILFIVIIVISMIMTFYSQNDGLLLAIFSISFILIFFTAIIGSYFSFSSIRDKEQKSALQSISVFGNFLYSIIPLALIVAMLYFNTF